MIPAIISPLNNDSPTTMSHWLATPNWDSIEPLQLESLPQQHGTYLRLETNVGELGLSINALGLRLSTAKRFSILASYGLLQNEPEPLSLTMEQNQQSTHMRAADYLIEIAHSPFALRLYRGKQLILSSSDDAHFERRYRLPTLTRHEGKWFCSLALDASEPVYGLGEKWGSLNKRGQPIRSWNQDALGVNAEASYKNTPFAWSPKGWGVFSHTEAAVTHAVGYAPWSHRSYCLVQESESLDLFFFLASPTDSNAGAELIAAYTSLTGRASVPPDWSAGIILSKAYYQDTDEILNVAHTVREKGMPCDVITFDGRAWQNTQTRFAFEWDKTRYPNPEIILKQLKALNFKICVWEYPLISTQHPWFSEFAEKGWLLTDSRNGQAAEYHWDQRAFGKVLTPLPTSGIVDFTHPQAYEFWRDAHQPLFEQGVDMIKADFGEQIEPWMQAHNGATGAQLHNVYAFLYNQCVFEAAERYAQSGPFLFSRAAWSGSQRFNSQWGGDPQADWQGMMANLRGGLSWGLSGAPFYATDVGGFYQDQRNDDLYVRWAQAAIFSAHFRFHGIGDREPWAYSKDAETAVLEALNLRSRLRHYLKVCYQQAANTGLPVQRPMVLAFPQDIAGRAFENQFMFGEQLLVVPCDNPQGEVVFYLPEGQWRWFCPPPLSLRNEYRHELLPGLKVHRRQLKLNEIAVFVKEGTTIELCDSVDFINTDKPDVMQPSSTWPASPDRR